MFLHARFPMQLAVLFPCLAACYAPISPCIRCKHACLFFLQPLYTVNPTLDSQCMEDQEDLQGNQQETVQDWLEYIDQLPAVPPSLTQSKYTRLFAVDVGGVEGHDQYVYIIPNGLCIVGLAPSHTLLKGLRAQHQKERQVESAAAAAQQEDNAAAASASVDAQPEAAGNQNAAEQEASVEANGSAAGTDAAAQQHGSTVGHKRKADAGKLPADADNGGPMVGGIDTATACPNKKQAVADDTSNHQQPATVAVSSGEPAEQQAEGAATEAAAAANNTAQSEQHAEGGATEEAEAANGAIEHPAAAAVAAATDGAGAPKQQAPTAGTAAAAPSIQLHVSFDIGNRSASIKQSGKKRNQGSFLDAHSTLCIIEAHGKPRIKVQCVASGKLMEVNQRLSSQPQLMLTRPCREGYLGILFPKDHQLAALRQSLMPVEQYLRFRGLTEEDIA